MHRVILERLEEYLSNPAGTGSRRDFAAHLQLCEECATELREMSEVSAAFSSLRPSEAMGPSPAFYTRLRARLDSDRRSPAWSWFFPDPALARRIMFASLMTLATLGGFLISRESEYASGPTRPEAVMSEMEPARNPDMMLTTLASYEP